MGYTALLEVALAMWAKATAPTCPEFSDVVILL